MLQVIVFAVDNLAYGVHLKVDKIYLIGTGKSMCDGNRGRNLGRSD